MIIHVYTCTCIYYKWFSYQSSCLYTHSVGCYFPENILPMDTWRLQSCCFSDWHLLLHVYEYNWRIRSYHTNFVHVKLFLLYLVILMWFETVKLLSYPISCILTTKQFATKSIIMIINDISLITEELLPFKCFFQSHGLSCRCSSRCNGKAWKRNC